jgi:hypothetical protein
MGCAAVLVEFSVPPGGTTMRIWSVIAPISAILLGGCQSAGGSLDWHRAVLAVGRTAAAGGGLMLGGPAGAAAGLTIGSKLFDNTTVERLLAARSAPRAVRPRMAQPSAPRLSSRSGGPAPAASPAPQEAEKPKSPSTIPAATPGAHSKAETLDI